MLLQTIVLALGTLIDLQMAPSMIGKSVLEGQGHTCVIFYFVVVKVISVLFYSHFCMSWLLCMPFKMDLNDINNLQIN